MNKETIFKILIVSILVMGAIFTVKFSLNSNKKSFHETKVYGVEKVDSTEYQFKVIDDSAVIYNNNRYVGTIKLNGTLDSLIILDNE